MPPRLSGAAAAAFARRESGKFGGDVDVEWFIQQVQRRVTGHVSTRTRVATEYLKSRVVKNISRPVTKYRGPRGGLRVTNRSSPGEYPKAETSRLLRDIFSDIKRNGNVVDGYVGTTLDYGLILETSTRLDRQFLQRTLREETENIKRLLIVPIPGGT